MSSCCSSSGSSRMGSSTVAWGPYGGEPIEDGDERADIPGSGSTPDRLAQIELGTGVALFELSPVFVSSPTQGADLVAAHDYGDGQQLLVVVSAGHIWLNYQVGRCQPYVKSFGLPGPCVALALAPDGVRMALIGADAIVHIVDVDDAIRSPQIDYEPVTLGAEVNPHALCWWRDSAGRDLVVVARADRPGAVVIDVEMLSQEPIEIGVEIADIQALGDDRLLLRDVDGAYYWLGDWRLSALARFRRGVSIRAQSHCRDGPVWSVYTPSRSILELFGPDLKGAPISAHLVPESRQQIVFDNYIFCISSDKIEVVSLVLSDIHFEFTSSTGAAFDVALATMQTIPTSEPLTAHVISSSMGRAAQDHPPLLAWSSTAVRRVFRSSSIIDLVEIVVSAFVDRAGDSAPLPSPDQIALLALSLRLDPPDFFEFAGDRAWSVERNFAVAFDFYQRSQLSFHKLVRLCMEASRHCDIVDVVDGVLAQRPALTDKNRGELAHCQFFCLLHACLESGDDQRLFKFGRRSRDLDARRALDALRATNDLDLMLRWCLAHDLVDDYLAIRAQGSTRSLSSQEVDVLVEAGHRSAILANEIVFLALDVGDQLRLLVADVDSVGDRLWSALLTLPFRIPSASLPSLFRTLKPLGAMIPIYILSALLLLDTIPGYLDQSVLATQLEEWRPLADYPKLIEICLAQNPPLRMGAALLLEHNQNRCEAALTRLSAASEVFVADRFVRVLMAEIRKLDAVDEKSLLILMAQQIWQHKSSSPFESVLVPFVDELAPVILSVPSPWVTSRLFLLALTSSPEMKVFERDDYGGALQRVLASPELLHLLTGSRSVTFTFRHDSPPLPLHVHPCGLLYHHPS